MSAAVKITRTEHDAAALRAIAGKCRDGAQVRRLLAVAMVLEGHTRAAAAERNGMDRQTLRDWVHRYNDGGVAALVSRTGPGPTPRLNTAQMAQLRELVLAGPDPEVHKLVRWRCVDLRDEVARRFVELESRLDQLQKEVDDALANHERRLIRVERHLENNKDKLGELPPLPPVTAPPPQSPAKPMPPKPIPPANPPKGGN